MATTTTAISSDDKESGTVTINVANKIAVDVSPADLSFTKADNSPQPGDTVNNSDNNYTAVEVENVGSENITEVWLNTSTPDTSPFGSGLQQKYDAGNWIQVNGTGELADGGVAGPDSGFTYVNRKDFNESNDLSYVFTPDESRWDYGRFRAGNQEFFWAINVSSTGTCDASSGESPVLRVGTEAHNKTNTGTTDFTDGGGTGNRYWEFAITSLTGSDYGLAPSVNYTMPSGNVRKYDVLTKCDGSETHTLRGKYNPTMGGADDLTVDGDNIAYMLDGTSSEAAELQPGEHFRVDTQIEVPFGVASSGSDTTGKLRVKARANN